jgi:hypothetical protein
MADQEHKVKVSFEVEKKPLEDAIKQTSKSFEDVQNIAQRLSKVSTRGAAERAKYEFKISNPSKHRSEVAAQKEKQKYQDKILVSLRKELTDRNAILDSIKKAAKVERDALSGGGGAPVLPGGRGRGTGGYRAGGGRFSLKAGVAGLMARLPAFALGAVGAGTAAQMRLGYGAYTDYLTGLGGLAGTGARYSQARGLRGAGERYGYSAAQTIEQARGAAIATGQAGSVTKAQALSRATTLDIGQATSLMGALTRAGTGFGGQAGVKGNRELEKVISLGFRSGIDHARIPEFVKGVEQVLQLQGGRQGGVVAAGDYAYMLKAMGATGAAGLQGARGAAVLQQLNEAMVKPGGGEAGQALMLQAMGFGKPGGNTNYYEALRAQERGANPENVARLFAETRGQFGGGEEQVLALREMTGLGITQLEELRRAVQMMPGDKREAEIARILEESKPIDEQALSEMKEVGFHTKRIAELNNRLVNIGEDNYEYIVKIQDAINTFLSVFIPPATAVLDKVSWLIDKIANMLPGDPYSTKNEGTTGKLGSPGVPAVEALKGAIEEIKRDPFKGIPFLDKSDETIKEATIDYFDRLDPMLRGKLGEAQVTAMKAIINRNPALQTGLESAARSPNPYDDEAFIKQFLETNISLQRELKDEIGKAVNKTADAAVSTLKQQNTGPAYFTREPELSSPWRPY